MEFAALSLPGRQMSEVEDVSQLSSFTMLVRLLDSGILSSRGYSIFTGQGGVWRSKEIFATDSHGCTQTLRSSSGSGQRRATVRSRRLNNHF
jgi:hypothetical protein